MKHKFITSEDCICKAEDNCPICDGGLAVCSVCRLYEGALTTDCPRFKSTDKEDDIYDGKIDYREGQGWVKEKNPTNQMWEKAAEIQRKKREAREINN